MLSFARFHWAVQEQVSAPGGASTAVTAEQFGVQILLLVMHFAACKAVAHYNVDALIESCAESKFNHQSTSLVGTAAHCGA